MEMEKGLVAPWTAIVEVDAHHVDVYYVVDAEEGLVVRPSRELTRQQACVIGAAPDMLAALKLADTILDGFPLYSTGHGAKVIRAAIAKAEGVS